MRKRKRPIIAPRICEWCEETYVPNSQSQKVCGEECRRLKQLDYLKNYRNDPENIKRRKQYEIDNREKLRARDRKRNKRKGRKDWEKKRRSTPEYKAWQKFYDLNRAESRRERDRKRSKTPKRRAWRKKRGERFGNMNRGQIAAILLEREGPYCGICGDELGENFHVDHIVPRFLGGSHDLSNLRLTHPSCNLSRTMEDYEKEKALNEKEIAGS